MRLLAALLLPFALSAQAPQVAPEARPHENLNAVLWTQTALEHDALCRQACALAELRLTQALRDRSWSAALEQGTGANRKAPAIILDIDETILDNSPAQARFVRSSTQYDPQGWTRWVEERAAPALPGAVEFTQLAARRGVTVFYVSNRAASEEAATRENLKKAGFPLSERMDTLLLRGEKPEWSSDKESRRAHVAAKHRILLLLGDDLGDFLPNARAPLADRRLRTEPHQAKWGREWIILPNPMYGSWENSILLGLPTGGTAEEQDRLRLRQKHQALRP